MDELPPDARELLRLARDQHGPHDLAARARVRASLHEAMTTGAARASLFKSGALATGAKVGLATLALGVLTTLAVVRRSEAPTRPEPAREAAPVRVSAAPRVLAPVTTSALPAPVPAAAPQAPATASAPLEAQSPATPRAARSATALARQVDTLAGELELMQRVSHAIDAGDTAEAAALLERHRTHFARPVLSEERAGFAAVVGCMAKRRGAQAGARSFLARYPSSLLRERVAHACEREEESP